MNFEQEYQAQFEPIAAKYPVGTKVFANSKFYEVSEYFGSGNRYGIVAIDHQGNEKDLYDGDFEKVSGDTQTCGRCGGSGRYSHCQKYGSTCFGCGGSGVVPKLPKAATKSLNLVVNTDGLLRYDFKNGDKLKAKFINVSEKHGEPIYMVSNEFGTGFKMRLSTINKNCEVK